MRRTESFRQQHQEILQIVKEMAAGLDPQKLAKDAGPMRSLLSKLVGKVSMHLTMEDNSLYPLLIAGKDAAASQTAKVFQTEMGGIKTTFTAYAQRWPLASDIQAQPAQFVSETKQIFAALGNRIEKEENDLYVKADKAA